MEMRESVVTRSISGHLTEQMQLHYSTVNPDEQRRSIGKVIDVMQVRERRAGGTQSAPSGTHEASSETPQNDASSVAGVLNGADWYSKRKNRPSRAGSNRLILFGLFGAGEGIRTLDVNLGKVALYH